MLAFIEDEKKGLIYSRERSLDNKAAALNLIASVRSTFEDPTLDKKTYKEIAKELTSAVGGAIDRLALIKDSTAYTFKSSINRAINNYFAAGPSNAKEEKRYAKEKAKYDKIIAKGKTPDYSVIPAKIVDIDMARENILHVVDKLAESFKNAIATKDNYDIDKEAVAMIDFLKEKAQAVAYRVTKRIAKSKALKLMEEVGIPEPKKRYRQYPFQFSGGMRQRIVIAIALAANPDILICDEPTTALDVTIQAQILELINKIKKERNLSIIFITHDLGVVANMADRIAVMYAGKIVEMGTAEDVFYAPAHPYTWALLSSMPDLDTNEKLEAIPGTPPNMIYPPKGDAFAARNKYAMKIDFEEQPPMFKISDTHSAATWLLHPNAPKVELPKAISARIERMKEKNGLMDGATNNEGGEN
ncbi:MAG: ATP-binding cassette domain-containing protein [Clostridia bacterium]|nr:ATP-binding cassette domain-containing protein [Clostridia bacterium]